MFLTLIRINYMDCFVSAVEALFYERKQRPIFFFVVMKESADMTSSSEERAGKGIGAVALFNVVSPTLGIERWPIGIFGV